VKLLFARQRKHTIHHECGSLAANFEVLLKARPAGKPFCFWYGANSHIGLSKKGERAKVAQEARRRFGANVSS